MDWEKLREYKHFNRALKVNYLNIPITVFPITREGAAEFNEIYKFLISDENKNMHTIIRTKSGGISISKKSYFSGNVMAWDIRCSSSGIEITVLNNGAWRFQFRNLPKKDEKENKLYGRQAFIKFKQLCQSELGIDLNDYALTKEEGLSIKKEIPMPKIELAPGVITGKTRVYFNVHHIDFHNSYPAGLCNTHPEFRPLIERLYKERKDNPENKAILNYTIGFMQQNNNPLWAHLAKDAITDNLNRITELANRLRQNYKILSYNTDGIWYQDYKGLGPYHGDGEGKNLGQWENDHQNCSIRFKSAGSYEYRENGVYTPVVRGLTRLDAIKPRSEWTWGAIFDYDASPILFKFDNKEGVIML